MVRKCWLWYGKPKLTCPDLEQIGTCLSYEGWTDEEKVKRYKNVHHLYISTLLSQELPSQFCTV
jgi:hypothetical protein